MPENEVPVTLVKTPLTPVNVVKEAVVPVAVTKCPLVVETVVPVIVPLTYTLSPDKVPVIKGEVIIVSKLPDCAVITSPLTSPVIVTPEAK